MIADILFSLFLIVLSAVWIVVGVVKLDFWIPGVSAGSGFIPTVFAAICLVLSIMVILSALRKGKGSKDEKSGGEAQVIDGQVQVIPGNAPKSALRELLAPYIPVIFSIAGIFGLTVFGLVITVFAISIIWLISVSRIHWKSSFTISIVLTLFVYLVFDLWLKVPFPRGIINF